jgi:hypothetical protein
MIRESPKSECRGVQYMLGKERNRPRQVTQIVIGGFVLHFSSKTLVRAHGYYRKYHNTYDAGFVYISADHHSSPTRRPLSARQRHNL